MLITLNEPLPVPTSIPSPGDVKQYPDQAERGVGPCLAFLWSERGLAPSSVLPPEPPSSNHVSYPQGLLCAPFLFIFILTKGLINNWRLVDKGGNSWLHFKRRLSDRFGKLFRIQKHKALMVEWLSEELVVWGIRQSQIILQRWLLIPKGSMFSQAGITMSYDFLRGTRPLWLLTSFSLSRKRIGLDFL